MTLSASRRAAHRATPGRTPDRPAVATLVVAKPESARHRLWRTKAEWLRVSDSVTVRFAGVPKIPILVIGGLGQTP